MLQMQMFETALLNGCRSNIRLSEPQKNCADQRIEPIVRAATRRAEEGVAA